MATGFILRGRKMIKRNKIFFLVLSLTAALLLFCGLYINNSVQSQLKSVTQLRYNENSGDSSLPILDIENISEKINMNDVSFCSEQDLVAVKGENITPVLTNEFYFENYGNLIFGSGISEDNIQKKENCAVISDSLALKLFLNTNAVGKVMEIEERNYKVIGVYEKSSGFLGELSNDDKERVYIPYTAVENSEYCRVDQITYSNEAFSAALIEQMNLEAYYSVDFSEKSKVMSNFRHIINFVLFAALTVLVLRFWCFALKRLAFGIKGDLSNEYFLRLLRTKPQKPILFVLTVVLVPLVLLALFFLADFSIYIIPKYLPDENIFDVSHYVEVIIKNANATNALALNGNPYFNNIYIRSFNLLLWLTAMFIIVFAVWFYFVFKQANMLIQKHNLAE